MDEELRSLTDRLRSIARLGNPEVAASELEGVRIEDLADSITRMDPEEGLELIKLLPELTAAELLVELPTETAKQYVQELDDATLAHFIDILEMDDALEFREELGPERFDAILQVVPAEDVLEIRRLLTYPPESVGRYMTEKFFEVQPDMTMTMILADIRRAKDDKYETVNDIYVLGPDRHLMGVFSLRKGIRADPSITARDLMRKDVISVEADDPVEEAARTMARYGFYALPVVDGRGHMVGLFTGDDAQEILREAETEDVLALGAVSGSAESYLSLDIVQLVKRRLPWLGVLFLAETLTGAVLRHYLGAASGHDSATGKIAMLAQLAMFIPLLIGAGGNAGSQVTTTITRSLAVGEVHTGDVWLIFRKEFVVSLLIGGCLGLVGFLRALLGWGSPLSISLIVGLALPAIVIWASSVGAMLPLAAKRLGFDPAVMSAPLITTFVDATGLIIYFEIARSVLGASFTH